MLFSVHIYQNYLMSQYNYLINCLMKFLILAPFLLAPVFSQFGFIGDVANTIKNTANDGAKTVENIAVDGAH